MIRREIIELVESEYLRKYLLENMDKLSSGKYLDIIGGAPVDIEKRAELMKKMIPLDDKAAEEYEIIQKALDILYSADGSKYLLSLVDWCYDDECQERELSDARPFLTWETAQNYAKKCYAEEKLETEFTEHYYEIEVYEKKKNNELVCIFSFYLSEKAEPQYIDLNHEDKEYSRCFSVFSGGGQGIPVPYKPGDILKVDCTPYMKPAYCLVVEVRDNVDCCGVQCIYPTGNGKFSVAAFRHNAFSAESCKVGIFMPMSVIFRANLYIGILPPEYQFFTELSKKIIDDPKIGVELVYRFYRTDEDEMEISALNDIVGGEL